MLVELSIRNLAVIESVHVSFYHGFHVLTGETGAGKSMIIDALSLIVGGRASSDLVRYGSDKAEIEAMFDMPEEHPVWDVLTAQGISFKRDEHLIIRREVTSTGKSTSRINGQLVNITMLRDVGEKLVNIHGQHEHQSLLKSEQHLQWLDLYGDQEIAPIKEKYRSAYNNYRKVLQQLTELKEASKQSLQMLDLYQFQIEEISAAGLQPGEDELLMEERRKLANAEKMAQAVSDGYEQLYGGSRGLQSIQKVITKLEEIVEFDRAALQPVIEQMQSAYYQLEDAAFLLRDYREQVEFNPVRLEQVEQRLDLLVSFRRKYGNSATEILEYLERIQKEVQQLENKDEIIEQLQKSARKEFDRLIVLGHKLSVLRKQAAKRLCDEIETELKDLMMSRTRLEVKLEMTEDAKGWNVEGRMIRFTKDGWDTAEFLISPNPGEPLRPLHKIASGGELSRIMLAMKSIFAKVDRIPVLVFDEVDTGVSGRAAQAIAEKMSTLSRSCQVFSITHLPQVACLADRHYEIRKEVEAERTSTNVIDMSRDARIHELARMLGGVEVTGKTLEHAKEMLQLADEKKIALQDGIKASF